MLGAIIGDIIGSRFEFINCRDVNFELFDSTCCITDDSVETIATMDWLLTDGSGDYAVFLRKWCRKYPDAGYSPAFVEWVNDDNAKAYNSFGNGAAMRVSPVALYATTDGRAPLLSEKTAIVSHNHKEGIKGAEAITMAAYWAKRKESKEFIKKWTEDEFGYKLDLTLKKNSRFDATCQITVPQAISCFIESDSFESAIRLAVSLGGDTDTIAAMTGGIAEAYYGIPDEIKKKALAFIPDDMKKVIDKFYPLCAETEAEARGYKALKRFGF